MIHSKADKTSALLLRYEPPAHLLHFVNLKKLLRVILKIQKCIVEFDNHIA